MELYDIKLHFYFLLFFFFKQKTAYEIKECDWSSDVCSSDLPEAAGGYVDGIPPALGQRCLAGIVEHVRVAAVPAIDDDLAESVPRDFVADGP